MKNNPMMRWFIIPAIIMAGLLISAQSQREKTDTIKAGIAKILITPTEPVRMSGYDARKDPFKGVHDDLYACAVVFDNGIVKSCLITSDVIGYSKDYVAETCKRIFQITGISQENIMITCAHNHGGPMTTAYGDELTEKEKAYVKTLQDKLVKVASDAFGKLQPVKIGVGKGACKMNINRRAKQAEGGIWLGRNPDGICDHEVGVIRIDDMASNTIGVLVNWPCHGTTGGQENYQITGDWPGAAARDLEKEFGKAVIMVSAGASGDINPIYGPNNDFNDINSIGMILAGEVKRVCNDIETINCTDLKVITRTIKAAGKKRSESRMPNVSLDPAPNVDITLCSMKVGNIVFCGISGELMNEIGLKIKEESPFKNTFILTHSNGSSGYLCTDKAYEEGGYEPMVSETMPGTAKLIVDSFRQMNNGL